MLKDNQGRAYAKLSEVVAGMTVELDPQLAECSTHGQFVALEADEQGQLFYYCTCLNKEGAHYIEGQVDSDDDCLVGIYHCKIDPQQPG